MAGQGLSAASGIALILLRPATDGYALNPANKLELGEAELALAPFASVISPNTKATAVRAVAIAALLQEDLSLAGRPEYHAAVTGMVDQRKSKPKLTRLP